MTKPDPIAFHSVGGNLGVLKPIFSPDSKNLLVACGAFVNVYSNTTSELIGRLVGHTEPITSLHLNPFNKHQLYTSSTDGTIRVWDYEEGKELYGVGLGRKIIQMSPSTKFEGILFVVSTQPKKNDPTENICLTYEVYCGLKPKTETSGLGTKNSSAQEISREQAEKALFGTGLTGPDGKEILKKPSLSKKELDQRIKEKQHQMSIFPTLVKKQGNISVYYELKLNLTFPFPSNSPISQLHLSNGYLLFHHSKFVQSFPINGPTDRPPYSMLICENEVRATVANPKGKGLAIGFEGGPINIWEPRKMTFNSRGIPMKIQKSTRPKKEATQLEYGQHLHWHAYRCSSLCYTDDGIYLLSGGSEGVLVIWQLGTGKRQFLPGLGAPLQWISVSPDGRLYAVTTSANCIHLINALNLKIQKSITSIVHDPVTSQKNRGLEVDPNTGFLVFEGSPGVLQFYNPITNHHGLSLVVCRNQDSHEFTETPMGRVEQFKFTASGEWLITADTRPIILQGILVGFRKRGGGLNKLRQVEHENQLSFWKFNRATQLFELNTQLVSPHKQLTSMCVCPATHRLVTTDQKGKFMMWEAFSASQSDGSNRFLHRWRCRSVGYYRNTPTSASAFSHDGSLLAICYENVITLWDPDSLTLKHTLAFSPVQSALVQVSFVPQSGLLVAASRTHVFVWNLLTLSVWWYSEVCWMDSVAVDPLHAQFTLVTKQLEQVETVLHRGELEQYAPFEFPKSIAKKMGLATGNQKNKKKNNNDGLMVNKGKGVESLLSVPETCRIPLTDESVDPALRADERTDPIEREIATFLSKRNSIQNFHFMDLLGLEQNEYEKLPGEYYMLTFNGNSPKPIRVTRVADEPRTNLIILDSARYAQFGADNSFSLANGGTNLNGNTNSLNQNSNSADQPAELSQDHSSVAMFLSGHSIRMVGSEKFIERCLEHSIASTVQAKDSKMIAQSAFAEIYGELRHATQQLHEEASARWSGESKSSQTLNAPTHLIPSLSKLYSSFMDELLNNAAPDSTAMETPVTEDGGRNNFVDMEIDQDETPALPQSLRSATPETELFPDFNLKSNSQYSSLVDFFTTLNIGSS